MDSTEYGPENYKLSLRYFLLADCLRNQEKKIESRNVLRKLIHIWTTTLVKKINNELVYDPETLYITEAFDILSEALSVIEGDLGSMDVLAGECEKAIGLIEMIRGNIPSAMEHMQKALDTLNNTAGQFDSRTEEAQNLIKMV